MERYLKNSNYSILMNKRDLEKLSKEELIELLLKKEKKPKVVIVDTKPTRVNRPPPLQEVLKRISAPERFRDGYKPTPAPRRSVKQLVEDIIPPPEQFRDGYKPTPAPRTGKWAVPRKSVKQMVEEYEGHIILPPEQFRDGYKPIPKPRTDRPLQMRRPPKPTRKPPPPPILQVEDHIINVPVPKIKELNKALKGHAKSYGIELQDNLNPLNHFTKTKELVESHLENLLKDMKGFKFIETLEVKFEKDSIDSKTGKRVSIYKTAFFNSKAKIVTKASDIEHELNMSRQDIMNAIDKWVSEGSGWVINRINSHYINITLYKPLNGSSYIELPTELKNPKKGLINMKNKDDECLR